MLRTFMFLGALICVVGLATAQDDEAPVKLRRGSHNVAPVTSARTLEDGAARALIKARAICESEDYDLGPITIFKAYSGDEEAVGAIVELKKANGTSEVGLFVGAKHGEDQWIQVPREYLSLLQQAAERCK